MSINLSINKKHFVGHKTIGFVVEGLVHGNAFSDGHQHNRETLDDLIYDLNKFRDSLPSVEEYAKEGKL